MSARSAKLKTTVVLLLLGGYLVLGYPFMQLRIPPVGFGVPFGELLLAVVLVGVSLPVVAGRMGTIVSLVPMLILWFWGFTRLVIDAANEGPWAFRDGTQLIESLFIIVGFALFQSPQEIQRLSRWVRIIVITACLYGLLFLWGQPIMAISPTLPGGSDQAIPIFGTFATTGTMLLWGAFYFMIQPADRPLVRLRYGLIASFLVSFAVLVIQARTTYVQLLAMAGLLLLVRPAALRGLALSIPVLAFLLLLISVFEIRFAGRLSSEISFDFLWNHIMAIFGIAEKNHGGVAEAASGVSLRFGWWMRLYGELTSDPATLLSGLGFGVPLTDFRDTLGVMAREPHNSVISVVARLGLVGGAAWIWLQAELFRAGIRAYRECNVLGRFVEARLVLLIVAFAVLTLASCFGEDTMEKPYNAIPYYLLWGAALRVAYNLRQASNVVSAERYDMVPSRSVP
jgi:hypothetical protein